MSIFDNILFKKLHTKIFHSFTFSLSFNFFFKINSFTNKFHYTEIHGFKRNKIKSVFKIHWNCAVFENRKIHVNKQKKLHHNETIKCIINLPGLLD